DVYQTSALGAWLAVQVFKQVAASIKGPITQASFAAAIKTATKIKMGGIIPNLNFTKCLAAGPYGHVYNWTSSVAKWDVTQGAYVPVPKTIFDGLKLAYGSVQGGSC